MRLHFCAGKIGIIVLGFGIVGIWKGFSQTFLAFWSFSLASEVDNREKDKAVLLEIPHLFEQRLPAPPVE